MSKMTVTPCQKRTSKCQKRSATAQKVPTNYVSNNESSKNITMGHLSQAQDALCVSSLEALNQYRANVLADLDTLSAQSRKRLDQSLADLVQRLRGLGDSYGIQKRHGLAKIGGKA